MNKYIVILLAYVIIIVSCSPVPSTANSISLPTPTPGPPATPASKPCTLLHYPVTPEADLGTGIESRGHTSGKVDAAVTIIAISDYQCLQCAFLDASLSQIRLTHPNDVRVIYFHAPRTDRDKDYLAIQAVEAADLQGKFWEMHDLLFEKQSEWSALNPGEFEAWAKAQAAGLVLDTTRFQSDFEGQVVADRGHLLRLGVLGPQAPRPAEVGNARVGGDAGAGQHDDARGAAQPVPNEREELLVHGRGGNHR
mgnify:CR=1 FL=1